MDSLVELDLLAGNDLEKGIAGCRFEAFDTQRHKADSALDIDFNGGLVGMDDDRIAIQHLPAASGHPQVIPDGFAAGGLP